jgi:hypothetical protein
MVGFIRLALVAIVLYLIASVPALAVAGRWVKGFGASGLATDDAQATDRSLKALQQQVTDLKRDLAEATVQIGLLTTERDLAQGLADRLHDALARAKEGRRNPPG